MIQESDSPRPGLADPERVFEKDHKLRQESSAILSEPMVVGRLLDASVERINKSNANIEKVQHQVFFYRTVQSALVELKADGLIDRHWQIYPSQYESPADKAGADYILLNRANGSLYFLDPSSNRQKTEGEVDKNVFSLRQQGVIHYEKFWYDEGGSLKSDDPRLGDDIKSFRQELKDRLQFLAQAKAEFNLLSNQFPLPSLTVKTGAETRAELESLVRWAEVQAASGTSAERALFGEMALVISRAYRHTDKVERTQTSDLFAARVEKSIQKVLLDYYIFGKDSLRNSSSHPTVTPIRSPANSIVFDGADGVVYKAGESQELFSKAWQNLINGRGLAQSLTNQQLKEWGVDISRFKGLSAENRALELSKLYSEDSEFGKRADELGRRIHADRTMIERGGSLGNSQPIFLQALRDRLSVFSQDALLGKNPNNEVKEAPPKFSEQILREIVDYTGGSPREAKDRSVITALELMIEEKRSEQAESRVAQEELRQLEALFKLYAQSEDRSATDFRQAINERLKLVAQTMPVAPQTDGELKPLRETALPALEIEPLAKEAKPEPGKFGPSSEISPLTEVTKREERHRERVRLAGAGVGKLTGFAMLFSFGYSLVDAKRALAQEPRHSRSN